ncbi:MAG: hypothetical protein KF797_04465 [Flavobacteriales bacterium]|nr:hypothetical protein [Flavobacteriales bacterium]
MARAYGQVLSWSDLRHVVPLEATPADSAALADQYIEAWLKQQVVLHMAEQNQVAERLDMEAQLEDYRRSLVIFNYEQALVDQKLDTVVSQQAIERYYTEHEANFELKETIVRMRWFKVNEPDKRMLRRMEERFQHGTAEDLHELELWLAGNGVSIVDRSASWIPRTTALAELALPEKEMAAALSSEGRQVIRSDHSAWFVDVVELRAQNSTSPIGMVKADIRAILLNQRKIQLIEDMRSSIYAQAIENKDVERIAP